MPEFVATSEWNEYKDIINKFHEDAFQQDITWRKLTSRMDLHGEDLSNKFNDITLKCLCNFNDYRSWPVTIPSRSGFIDAQSVLVYFNTKYLKDNGYTTSNDFLNLDPLRDRFILNGKMYVAMGESETAQASNQTLLQFIILKREETKTENDVYPVAPPLLPTP